VSVAPALTVARCYACRGTDHVPELELGASRLVRCRACGFHLVSPRVPDEVVLERLQRWAREDVLAPERLGESRSDGARRFLRRELGRIRGLLGGAGRLLDVGCATGALLEEARAEGFEVMGVELGLASSTYARERLGLPVLTGDFLEARLPEASFDVVTLYEVIEHLLDPLAILREVRRVLRPGGLLALSTPNRASLTGRALGSRWWPINCPEEHIHLFTPGTVREVLRRAGLEVADLRTSGLDPLTWVRALRGREGGWASCASDRQAVRGGAARAGLLGAARTVKAAVDACFESRRSPLRDLGERLFAYARRSKA
jgi:SAM-dependent methyltransferase